MKVWTFYGYLNRFLRTEHRLIYAIQFLAFKCYLCLVKACYTRYWGKLFGFATVASCIYLATTEPPKNTGL